jgi:hypothetical protein
MNRKAAPTALRVPEAAGRPDKKITIRRETGFKSYPESYCILDCPLARFAAKVIRYLNKKSTKGYAIGANKFCLIVHTFYHISTRKWLEFVCVLCLNLSIPFGNAQEF